MSEWGKVPKEAFTDRRLSRTDVRVLGILCAHANGKTGLCTRKQGLIATELDLTRETVNRALKKLATLGYVEPRARPGMKRSLDYRVLVSDGAAGQLGLFEAGETPRQAKPRAEKKAPRCERKITSVVTPEITSVVTLGVTSKEQTLVNREPIGSAQPRESERGEPLLNSEPTPIHTDGGGDADRRDLDRQDAIPSDQGERTGVVPIPAVPNREFMDRLEARLLEAAGGMLGRESLGLRVLTEPLGWLHAGCELERDILPTIDGMRRRWEAAAIRSPPKHTWRYFAAAVLEARDRNVAAARPAASSTKIFSFDTRGSHVPDPAAHRPAKGRYTDAFARIRRQFAGDLSPETDGSS